MPSVNTVYTRNSLSVRATILHVRCITIIHTYSSLLFSFTLTYFLLPTHPRSSPLSISLCPHVSAEVKQGPSTHSFYRLAVSYPHFSAYTFLLTSFVQFFLRGIALHNTLASSDSPPSLLFPLHSTSVPRDHTHTHTSRAGGSCAF